MPLLDRARKAAERLGYRPREARFARGDYLFRQDGELTGIHILIEGMARTSIVQANGKEALLAVIGPGEPLGELEYFLERGPLCDVVALEPSRSLFLSGRELDAMIGIDPGIAKALAGALARRLAASSARVAEGAAYPLSRNVLKALLGRGLLEGAAGGPPERPMALGELASYLGATPRHLSRVVAALAARGLLSRSSGKIAIADIEASRAALESMDSL